MKHNVASNKENINSDPVQRWAGGNDGARETRIGNSWLYAGSLPELVQMIGNLCDEFAVAGLQPSAASTTLSEHVQPSFNV